MVRASAEFEFADAGGPDAEVVGGGGEGEVLGAASWSQVAVVGHDAVAGEGLEELAGDGTFQRAQDGVNRPAFVQVAVAVGAGCWVVGQPHFDDVVQGRVGLSVPASG